jgi:hypothetical protein
LTIGYGGIVSCGLAAELKSPFFHQPKIKPRGLWFAYPHDAALEIDSFERSASDFIQALINARCCRSRPRNKELRLQPLSWYEAVRANLIRQKVQQVHVEGGVASSAFSAAETLFMTGSCLRR